ncbi:MULTISPECIES: heme biosynthesis HemY N-terminal domain-containing protein [Nitrincola]|uniref:HemY N-terminal domain-containing protein n=1 Tax=Nitrincola nitratireducens TaxID=1229521 RepID=W9UTW0_9GAMM|nr:MULTISPECIES: heme biosynthesis HemY N-terminal domain-containing protein [Nitrincola]EXJ10529.1 hypothetical protein D791_02594 [Nitrincola nitratireducens]
MKRFFLLVLIVLVAGAWAGQLMMQDTGYVLVAFKQTTIETTLWVFLIAGLIAFFIAHGLVNLFFNTHLPWEKFRNWREKRQQKAANKETLKGFLQLSQGDCLKAQNLLSQSAEKSGVPLINYLAAARAANEGGDHQNADLLLKKALKAAPEADVTIKITEAQFKVNRGQVEAALTLLLNLRRTEPRNKQILVLLKEVYVGLDDWQGLVDLLPDLKKYEALTNSQLQRIEKDACLGLLKQFKQQNTLTDENAVKHLQSLWVTLPKTVAKQNDVVAEYAQQLIEHKGFAAAETLLRETLNNSWSEKLIELYGQVQIAKPRKLLDQAKAWLSAHPESHGLRLALARLSLLNQEWEEAAEYYQMTLASQETPEHLAEYARLLKHLGKPLEASEQLNRSIELLSSQLPDLPLPPPALKAT